jgi:hypothetical protein
VRAGVLRIPRPPFVHGQEDPLFRVKDKTPRCLQSYRPLLQSV